MDDAVVVHYSPEAESEKRFLGSHLQSHSPPLQSPGLRYLITELAGYVKKFTEPRDKELSLKQNSATY